MTCGHPNPSSPLQGHLSPILVIRPSHEPRTNSLFSDPPSPASESSRKDYETLSDSIKHNKNFRSSEAPQIYNIFSILQTFPAKKTFLLLDTIRNANRPTAARMREASSFAPNGQRLPILWKSHILKVKQATIGFEQFFDILFEVASRTDNPKHIRNTRKRGEQFIRAYLSDCHFIHKRITSIVRQCHVNHKTAIPSTAVVSATIAEIGNGV